MNEKKPFDPELTNPDIDLGDLEKTRAYRSPESEATHPLEHLVTSVDDALENFNDSVKGKVLVYEGTRIKNARLEKDLNVIGEDENGMEFIMPLETARHFLVEEEQE